MTLAALKTMYLETYGIFSNAFLYARSVKVNNKDVEITSTIASAVIKVYSSYTDPFGIAEFSRIGWIQLVLLFIQNINVVEVVK